jgi:hypothetical protein
MFLELVNSLDLDLNKLFLTFAGVFLIVDVTMNLKNNKLLLGLYILVGIVIFIYGMLMAQA